MKTNEHGVHFCEFGPPGETITETMLKCDSVAIKVKPLVWEQDDDGDWICDCVFFRWIIVGMYPAFTIFIGNDTSDILDLFHEHITLEGAKIMVENRMREYVLSLLEVENTNENH